MKRIYKPYWEWEDYINGMWRKLPTEDEEKHLIEAIMFTGDHKKYGAAMRRVIKEWPNTMLNSLTNKSINRKAFLGHCACQIEINCPEYIVRQAWKLLTNEQRYLANEEARKTIQSWELKMENKQLYRALEK